MKAVRLRIKAIRASRRMWRELETEARRQGCSAADVFFDRTGQLDARHTEEVPLRGFEPRFPP